MPYKTKIVGIKMWASVDIRFAREVNYGFGAQVEASFLNSAPFGDDGISNEDVADKAAKLYKEVLKPAIQSQIKIASDSDKLLRMAIRVERPRVVKQYEKLLEKI